jgi:hypothetical protein
MSIAIHAARYNALFASDAQASGALSPAQLQQMITQTIRAHGSHGCACLVAQEFGDHPELAMARMRWAREQVNRVFAAKAQIPEGDDEAVSERVAA